MEAVSVRDRFLRVPDSVSATEHLHPMVSMKFKYMHTIKHVPAFFERDQIVYASKKHPARLEDSLSTIRKQQKQALKFRAARGWNAEPSRYDYIRIIV